MMFAKDSALVGTVNDIITDLKKEGFIGKTHLKWFGFEAPADSSTIEERQIPSL